MSTSDKTAAPISFKEDLLNLKNALAENPQQLAAYETLCGADIEATMEKYANNLWQKHVGEMEAQARMQRMMAAQPQAYTGGGNGR